MRSIEKPYGSKAVFCSIFLAIAFLALFPIVLSNPSYGSPAVVEGPSDGGEATDGPGEEADENNKVPKISKDNHLWKGVVIISIIGIAIVAFLLFAQHARKAIIENADDKSEVVEFLMKQTLGLPQGTVRGILALTTALVFVGSVFIYYENIPESVKIITALVFGYYFAKTSGQTKEVIEALQGKTKRQALLKQEANTALAEALAEGAPTYTKELFEEAQGLINEGSSKESLSEAISCYESAKKKAREAKQNARDKRRKESESAEKENEKAFNELSNYTRGRIDELVQLKIETRAIISLWETARKQADSGDFLGAHQTLERVKSMVDVLLQEYDEAKKLYEEKLGEQQKNELQKARENIDLSKSLGIKGDTLIETLLSIIGVLGDKDRNLISLFKKRVAGDHFEPSDVKTLYEQLLTGGKHKLLANVVDVAANSAGIKLSGTIRDSIENLDLLKKLVLGDDNVIDSLFRSDFVNQDESIERDTFDRFVNKIRKNIVDIAIGDSVKKGLPEGVEFDTYKKALKSSQEDDDATGALQSIKTVIDIGETILSFTPMGGAAKAIGAVARGLFKIFGK